MTMAKADFSPVRFSTAALPARDRVAIAREVVGRQLVGLDLEPLGDSPFHVEMTVRRLPALRVGTWTTSALRVERTPALIADDDDVFCLIMERGETSSASGRGRNVTLGAGEAVLMHSMDPCVTTHRESRIVCITVLRTALAPFVTNAEDATLQAIPANNEALRLLPSYLQTLCEELSLASPELLHLATTHVHDLVALTIGATRDGAALAEGRGLRAARLSAIKADIAANLGRHDLSLAFVSARHSLSTRHISRLFRAEDISFSDFVLEQRLFQVYRMLNDPRFTDRKISVIALECGFGDLSYFNRCFRRRFGCSPTEYREANGGDLEA